MLEAAAEANGGQVHLIDVHGQAHRPATEVGHMLTNTELRCSCCAASDPAPLDPARSSVAAMAALPGWTGVEDAVRGPTAIGTLLEDAGYPAVPSAQTPHPCAAGCDRAAKDCKRCADEGEGGSDCACPCPCTGFDNQQWRGTADGDGFGGCSFFWGANTLLRYAGGRAEFCKHQVVALRGKVAATQLETMWEGCRETDAQIDAFGKALAAAFEAHCTKIGYGAGASGSGASEGRASEEAIVG